MGTRGVYGLRKDGKDKLQYNHFDSYPECLGVDILNHVVITSDEQLVEQFNYLEAVDTKLPPTQEQKDLCIRLNAARFDVSTQDVNDWYCLLRNIQGYLGVQMPSIGPPYYIDNEGFCADSLFCEWGYIINLDDKEVEVYVGGNKNPLASGRYASLCSDSDKVWYGIRLLGTISFDVIRKSKSDKARAGLIAATLPPEEVE